MEKSFKEQETNPKEKTRQTHIVGQLWKLWFENVPHAWYREASAEEVTFH